MCMATFNYTDYLIAFCSGEARTSIQNVQLSKAGRNNISLKIAFLEGMGWVFFHAATESYAVQCKRDSDNVSMRCFPRLKSDAWR